MLASANMSHVEAESRSPDFVMRGELRNGTHVIHQPSPTVAGQLNRLIVFVHGLGHFNWVWKESCFEKKFLELGFGVVSYDLVGRGFSEFPTNGKFGLNEHLAQLHDEVITPLLGDVDEFHLIGHSQGGAICMG